MKHKLMLLYTWLVRICLFILPDTKPTMRFRGFLYSLGMKQCGKNFQVAHDAIIKPLEVLSVGKNVFVGNGVIILTGAGLVIQDNVLIGVKAVIVGGNHTFENGSYRFGKSESQPIELGEGCWICANATVTSGAVVPARSIVGPNSVFSKKSSQDAEPSFLYAGKVVAEKTRRLKQ